MQKLILITIIFTNTLSAQNLDSLYKRFTAKNSEKKVLQVSHSEHTEFEKCGVPLVLAIVESFDKFTKSQQNVISSLLIPKEMQKSIVSPSGFFRIHYDETGNNKPTYDVNELAIALDSSYNYEVNILGYLAPPTSASLFNENKYDVYVRAGNDYGITKPMNILDGNRRDSYIEIHNSFEGFYTEGIDAAKVTVAHEFHHAIQMGSYIFRPSDSYYYEITATSMEDFVYDEIDDYIFYLKHYFNKTYLSFPEFNKYNEGGKGIGGYEAAIWNLFLTQKYPEQGFSIIKRSWELMASPNNQPAVKAIANAVEEYVDDSFKNVFNKFGVWTFFTNYRTQSGKYFKDARNYPLVKYATRDEFDSNSGSNILASRETLSQTVCNNFMQFVDAAFLTNDTIWSIVTNGDVALCANNSDNTVTFNFTLQNFNSSGAKTIVQNKYYSLLSSPRQDTFVKTNIYNNSIVDTGIVPINIDYAYPQPFKLFKHDFVRIPVETNEFGKADLFIYSSSMNLVFNENVVIKNVSHSYVEWNGKDNYGDNVASGVYIYATNSEDNIKKGKIVILNE